MLVYQCLLEMFLLVKPYPVKGVMSFPIASTPNVSMRP
jgi:hypothetical protein